MTSTNDVAVSTGAAAPSHRRLGVPAVTFMIVAASAPLTVLAGGVTTTFAVTGVLGVPLSFLLLGATLAIFAVGYAAMSRYVTNAGAFYSYVAQGIGRPMGVGVSLVALVSYNAMQIGVYGLFGYQVASLLNTKFGWDVPWWLPILVCIAIVGALGVNRVDLSAKVLGVLVALEFLVVIVYDIASFVVAPEGVTAEALSPSALFVPGIGAVFAFGIAAFMGFESAAIYGEESKDPRRTVARATYTAVGVIAIFYALSSWAMTIASGPSNVVKDSTEQGPDLIFSFLQSHVGVLISDIAQVLFITSLFASLVSFHNAVARYFFSLGREGVLPGWLATVRRHSRAPWAGSLTQTVLAVVVIAAFALASVGWVPPKGAPAILFPVLTLFSWLTNTGALGLVLLMAIVSFAVIGFFRRSRHGLGSWQRVVAPAISGVLLGVVFILIVVYFNTLLTSDPTAPPSATTFLLPAIVIAAGVIGVVWGAVLKRRNPRVYAQIGHGTEEEGAPELGADADA
ncbi:APC family permease [uncultured Leifsonia sp.]|uniref:APC family permease n=1 Tax=uncultured Leifsonia sp. TaxID=340359 RepID=UPI0028D19290|nr:APC family permease [uncultured Leifsonia sp.]